MEIPVDFQTSGCNQIVHFKVKGTSDEGAEGAVTHYFL